MTRAVALALVLTTGCSFALTRRAPDVALPAEWPHCTEHRLWVLGDAGYAALAAVGTVVLATSHNNLDSLGVIVTLPMAIGFGAGALYGLHHTNRCNRVRDAYEQAALQGK